jgi:hypothetical protein
VGLSFDNQGDFRGNALGGVEQTIVQQSLVSTIHLALSLLVEP